MPVIKTLTNRFNTQVFVWQVTESEEHLKAGMELSQNSVDRLKNMRSAIHRRGFLSIRHLLKQAGYRDKDLFYNSLGKPNLVDGRAISITHSFELTAIIISDVPTGIDIEMQREKIQRIAVKFINFEREFVASHPEKVRVLTIIWGAKECLYKCLSRKGLGFYDHCRVNSFKLTDGATTSAIEYGNVKKTYDTIFEEIMGYTLVYILPMAS